MKTIILFTKGIFIGVAAVIPGLSASVFAVVVGLYDTLINSVATIKSSFRKNCFFLVTVISGAVVGVLISTNAVLFLCEKFHTQSYMFFLGLVLGSLPMILHKTQNVFYRPKYLILTVICAVAVLAAGFFSIYQNNSIESYIMISQISSVTDFIILFFCGIIACSLMSIPGVSGSITLMILGQYETVYAGVGKVAHVLKNVFLCNFDNVKQNLFQSFTTIPFLLGAVIGFLLIAKLISAALKKNIILVYFCVLGLVLGSSVILLFSSMPNLFNDIFLSLKSIILNTPMIFAGYLLSRLFDKSNVVG